MDYHILLGWISSVLVVVSFIPYIRGIFLKHKKPHAFSWFVWAVLTSIVFAVQLFEGGGPGSWVTGTIALGCTAVFIAALIKGERTFPLFDWVCLVAAGVALLLWQLTNNPTGAVILVTITDLIAYAPTFRKGFHHPDEETASAFLITGIAFLIGIVALESYSVSTWLYPAAIALTDFVFFALLLTRRLTIRRRKSHIL